MRQHILVFYHNLTLYHLINLPTEHKEYNKNRYRLNVAFLHSIRVLWKQ